jgi:hypothetical protein
VLRASKSLALPLLLGALACGQAPSHPAPAGIAPVAVTTDDDSLDLGKASVDAGACVGVEVAASPLPVDVFAVVDRSGSMSEATLTGVSKWYATKMAFHDFLQHAPTGMGFGLSLFPVPGSTTASCAADYYRAQALPINDVQQMADGAMARLDAMPPQGQTPTGPALTAALELAEAYALDHVDRSVVVVLATDGLPTTCAPTASKALALLAKAALEGPAHVRTLVVASRSLDDTDLSSFERIALAGGTERALAIDPHADFAAQLTSALTTAAARKVACDLAIPEPPAGAHLDYDAVNVVLDGNDDRVILPRVSGPASCTAGGGWYYDIDPAHGAPQRLNMCKSSCARADNSATGLRVELGCKSLVR